MRTIHKYELQYGLTTLEIPAASTVILAEMQGISPCLWLDLDDTEKTIIRKFCLCGTGHKLMSNAVHLFSFQEPPDVWHVYELI